MVLHHHSRSRRRGFAVIPLAAAASVAMILSGCSGGIAGGDDGGDSGAKKGGTISLGMIAPFSGSSSAFGDYMKNGGQMAIDEINKAGGINGSQLKLITADGACDATTAVAAANKLVTQGVVGSVGGYCSGATLPTLPIFHDAKIPMVIPAANSNDLVSQGLDNVFLINGTGAQQAAAAVKYVTKVGASKVAVLDDNTSYSKDLADTFVKDSKDAGKYDIALHESVTAGEKDYSANVNKVMSSHPDFFYYTGYYAEGGLITRQLRDAGYKGPIMVGDGSVDKKLADIAGKGYTHDVYATMTQTPDTLKGAEDWISNYKAAFNAAPGPYSTQAYDAVRVMAQGIKKAGTTDGDKVDKALEAIDGFKIFSGPLKFTPDHTLSSGGFVILKLQDDGTFTLEDDLLG